MKETGQKLKSIREQKGISLEEVVLATKIKMSSLRAIEEGDESKLPSKTFIRGFVQSYAKFLDTDEEEVLIIFQNEMGSTIDMPRKSDEFKDASETDRAAMKFANSTRHPLIKIFVGLGAIVLVTLIYFVSSTIDKYQEEKQLVKPTQEEAQNIVPLEPDNRETTTTTEVASEEDKVDSAETEIEPEDVAKKELAPKESPQQEEQKPEKEIAKKKTEKLVEKNETESPKKILPKKVEAPAVKKEEVAKKEIAEKKIEKVIEVKEEAKNEEADEEQETVTPKKVTASFVPQEIIIEALDEVELEFKTDAGNWVEIDLKPEQIHTIKGRNTIAIKVSNGGAVNIIHNGKDRGVPGTLGSEIELKYPE